MNTAAREARQDLFDELKDIGEAVVIRRGAGATAVNVTVRVRVTSFQPDELIGDIRQSDRKIIVPAPVALDPPLRQGDRILRRSEALQILAVDDSARRVGDELIAFEVRARG